MLLSPIYSPHFFSKDRFWPVYLFIIQRGSESHELVSGRARLAPDSLFQVPRVTSDHPPALRVFLPGVPFYRRSKQVPSC